MYTTHACSRNGEVKCERQVKINAVVLVHIYKNGTAFMNVSGQHGNTIQCVFAFGLLMNLGFNDGSWMVASNDKQIMLHVLRTFGERNGSAQGHK